MHVLVVLINRITVIVCDILPFVSDEKYSHSWLFWTAKHTLYNDLPQAINYYFNKTHITFLYFELLITVFGTL